MHIVEEHVTCTLSRSMSHVFLCLCMLMCVCVCMRVYVCVYERQDTCTRINVVHTFVEEHVSRSIHGGVPVDPRTLALCMYLCMHKVCVRVYSRACERGRERSFVGVPVD